MIVYLNSITSMKTTNNISTTRIKYCRDVCIDNITTEPHSPWQNPAEKRIGTLGSMVRNAMQTFGVPLKKHDWVQKGVCDVHNILADQKLG